MPETAAPRRSRRVLDVIAVFKFVKAVTLVAAGFGAFGLLNPRIARATEGWLERLALGHGQGLVGRLAGRAIPALDAAGPHRLELLGVGALVYAAVFLVEGVGLIRGRRWAEYLTIGVTISFLPIEVVELVRKASAPRAITLVLNVAVVVYLVWRLRAERHERTVSMPASA
jgi:uncharacterized membrane protein (DUF2068 family)